MIDTFRMRLLVVNTLQCIDAFSPEAVELILGTGAHESDGWKYNRQLGGGPALGYWQIEPFTHDDCWNNYLNFRRDLAEKILFVSNLPFPNAMALEYNNVYSICMARVKYMRDPNPIPADLYGQAQYWKRVYNSNLGKGTAEDYITHYQMYVL